MSRALGPAARRADAARARGAALRLATPTSLGAENGLARENRRPARTAHVSAPTHAVDARAPPRRRRTPPSSATITAPRALALRARPRPRAAGTAEPLFDAVAADEAAPSRSTRRIRAGVARARYHARSAGRAPAHARRGAPTPPPAVPLSPHAARFDCPRPVRRQRPRRGSAHGPGGGGGAAPAARARAGGASRTGRTHGSGERRRSPLGVDLADGGAALDAAMASHPSAAAAERVGGRFTAAAPPPLATRTPSSLGERPRARQTMLASRRVRALCGWPPPKRTAALGTPFLLHNERRRRSTSSRLPRRADGRVKARPQSPSTRTRASSELLNFCLQSERAGPGRPQRAVPPPRRDAGAATHGCGQPICRRSRIKASHLAGDALGACG